MSEKNNSVCSICGRPYYACMSCRDAMKLQPWKVFTDTANCYKVFQAVKGFSTGVYTKEEAKEKFKNIDLADVESFRPHIRDIVKEILKEDKPAKKVKTKETVVEEVVVAEVEQPVVEETVSRKRNYKVETE